jgi:hypothetical protein
MSKLIDELLSKGETLQALEECVKSKQYFLGLFILKLKVNNPHNLDNPDNPQYKELVSVILQNTGQEIINEIPVQTNALTHPFIRVKLLCNWCLSKELADCWNKMSRGNYTWGRIKVVWEGDVDYYVIINSPPKDAIFDKKRTILFRMEPHMSLHPEIWGEWANPDDKEFLKVLRHENGDYNNNEWHLSTPYSVLQEEKGFYKPTNTLSTILSGKYKDPGQVLRVDFIKFLENKQIDIHVYGENRWGYKNYIGSLPLHDKNSGLLQYKYTFNAENHSIDNYYTEKLIDGILAECLVFYWGCPNVKDYIDERAYVQLELSNFEKDYEKIQKAISEDWHTQRLPYIREAKKKILNELQFFPRLEKILK